MKKLIKIILAIMLILTLAACSGNKTESQQTENPVDAVEDVETEGSDVTADESDVTTGDPSQTPVEYGQTPEVVDGYMDSTLSPADKEAQIQLLMLPSDTASIVFEDYKTVGEEKVEIEFYEYYVKVETWFDNRLDELGFISTVPEESRKALAPILTVLYTGTIDGQPLTIVIYKSEPAPDGEIDVTFVRIAFWAIVE